jgi:hypothetical protein
MKGGETMRTGQLQIGNWYYPRIFFHTGKSVTVEIAREGCWPCPKCEGHVQAIDHRLQEAGATYEWNPSGVAQYVQIELPDEEREEVDGYLSRVLGVPVRATYRQG